MNFVPLEFESNYTNVIQATTPSLINYLPSSCTGSVQEMANDDIGSTTEEEEEVPDTPADERCEELWRAFRDLAGPWRTYRFFLNEWNSPGESLRNTQIDYDVEEEEYDEDADGFNILTKKIMASSLSRLDACPEFGHYAYTKCVLRKKKLASIDAAKTYHYLQYIDVSRNYLSTLKPLGNLPFLKYLDASHNSLENVLDFKAPFILTIVNLSHNKIEVIPDLSEFWSITDLNLSHNKIQTIEGISSLRYLNSLNLSSNCLTTVKNLDDLRIQFLYLQHNHIQLKWMEEDAFRSLTFLRMVNLSDNEVMSLKAFERVANLECLEAANNKIRELLDIYYLRNLKYLSKLNLVDNPVTRKKRYMEISVTHLEKLQYLDGEKINTDFWNEKFSNVLSDVYRKASYKRLKLLILEQMNKPTLWDWLQPYDFEPLNVVVLVGVEASKRSMLARKFQKIYPEINIAIPHTTRPKHENEVEGDHFYYIDSQTFSRMMKEGQFLLYEGIFGDSYGYTHAEFKKAENGTIIFYTNLVMALALKNNFLNTRLVLTIPSTPKKLLDNLMTLYAIRPVDSKTFQVTPSPVVAEECRKRFASDRWLFIEKEVEHILSDILHRICISSRPELMLENSSYNDGYFRSLKGSDVSSQHDLWDLDVEDGTESEISDAIYSKSLSEDSKNVSITVSKSAKESKEKSKENNSLSSNPIDLQNLRPAYSSTMTADFYLQYGTYMEGMSADATVRNIYDKVLKQREELLEIHWSTPGLFRDLVFTDYEEETMNKLDLIVQELKRHNAHKPLLNFKKDKSLKAVITAKVQDCFENLMRETNSSAKQAAQFIVKEDIHQCVEGFCTNPACPSF